MKTKRKVVYEAVDKGDALDHGSNYWYRESTKEKVKKLIPKIPKAYLPVVIRKVTVEVLR